MDAPPIPRLVDLVHAFNGVVVEQFRKRVEKLLSDSIPLWRLLKLLFKILQTALRIFRQRCVRNGSKNKLLKNSRKAQTPWGAKKLALSLVKF